MFLVNASLNELDISNDDQAHSLFFSLKKLMEKISQENKAWVRAFEKPNTSPNSLGKKGSFANTAAYFPNFIFLIDRLISECFCYLNFQNFPV
jgi:hypothetical protein